MNFQLVVLKPFAGYQRGDIITDIVTVEKVIAGPQASFVVRVAMKEG